MEPPRRTLVTRRTLLGLTVAATAAACSTRKPDRPAASGEGRSTTPSPTGSKPPRRTPSPQPVRRGPATEITHGSRRRSEVALTFHTAGDPAVVDAVLRAAHEANAGLTLLVVGTWLKANPQFARRIIAAGHDLGNHTWSHPVLPDDDAAMTREEIRRCRELLMRLTGNGGSWFRPSGTPNADPLILREAGAAGYPTSLSYDVDPLDYTDPGAAAVTQRVLDAARPGSIVSLHTLYAGTAEALPAIFAGLQHRGLTPVTCRTLLRKGAAV